MSSLSIIQRSALGLAILTSVGILIHDTKLDQATMTALALPAVIATFGSGSIPQLSGNAHTHVERVSFSQGMTIPGGGMPRIAPREDNRGYAMPKKVAKGFHGFDGYYLPDNHLHLAYNI